MTNRLLDYKKPLHMILNHSDLVSWASQASIPWARTVIRNMDVDYPPGADEVVGIKNFILANIQRRETIDPAKVVGQWDHFAGQTWLEALTAPQIKSGSMQFWINRADAHSAAFAVALSGVHLTSYDDGASWYSNTDGNNRMVVARFQAARCQAEGEPLLLQNCHTSRRVIDWAALRTFRALESVIVEEGLDIDVHPISDSESDADGRDQVIRFFIYDRRYGHGENAVRHGWLTANGFRKYAGCVIATKGKLPAHDRLLKYFGLPPKGDETRLVFPDACALDFTQPSRTYRRNFTAVFAKRLHPSCPVSPIKPMADPVLPVSVHPE